MHLGTRQLRYSYLREKCGFLHFEARELSKIAWQQRGPDGESICPYLMSDVIAPRRKLHYRYWHDKRRTKQTQEKYIATIKSLYKKKGWYETTETVKKGVVIKKKKATPWVQVRDAEKRYKKDAGPQYESPNIKRHRDMEKTKRLLNKRLSQGQQTQRDIEEQIWGKPL